MQPVVKLVQADVCQQNNAIVLHKVSFTVHAGEFTYLIGKTGSGKSSLLKTLYGALPLYNGVGEVAGFDLKTLTRRTIPNLRRQMGIVFQDFSLLTDRSVGDNLRFVLRATDWKDPNAIETRIREVLNGVGLLHKIEAMPYELSGGEQQRIVIARALLNRPAILLADEPTGNLDPETSDDILVLMRNLAREHNTAVLCATHDYRILQNFPARIIRILNGRIIDDEGLSLV